MDNLFGFGETVEWDCRMVAQVDHRVAPPIIGVALFVLGRGGHSDGHRRDVWRPGWAWCLLCDIAGSRVAVTGRATLSCSRAACLGINRCIHDAPTSDVLAEMFR